MFPPCEEEWVKPSKRPAPRRVRVWQNGHGAYIIEKIGRTNRYPAAHWVNWYGVVPPPREKRTQEALRAFMHYVAVEREKRYRDDFSHVR